MMQGSSYSLINPSTKIESTTQLEETSTVPEETTTMGNPLTFEVLYKNKMSTDTPPPLERNFDNLFDQIESSSETDFITEEIETTDKSVIQGGFKVSINPWWCPKWT